MRFKKRKQSLEEKDEWAKIIMNICLGIIAVSVVALIAGYFWIEMSYVWIETP